ncbi:F-box/LRR-repeat protein At4g29420 [Impatiens glandulifera]|uniref:F-box/LRR-repeat protein At4g29420 n=1 Tax=Impatiens glandulifera TaxID=253017 RepID=UPI001FB05F37|nr:F-box/LRR-repeat protein At4g29420 [Impatiens glandulifera]
MDELPPALVLEILNRLNNTTDLARCRLTSKSLNSIAAEIRSIHLQCSFDRYTKSRSPVTASQVTPFKEIFRTLISNTKHVVDSITIGVEKPLRGISFDDAEDELDDLYLTCVDFVSEWLPVHGRQLRSLSISDFWIQSCWRQSNVLSLISSFCHHLEEVELKNTWLSMDGLNKMHNLTSLTLEFIRLEDENLSKLNDCFPFLRVLILNEVGGLKEPMINLLHLTTCQWTVSNAPLSLSISAPKLVKFKLNCVRPNTLLIDAPLLSDFSITLSNTNHFLVKELPNLRTLKIESPNLGRFISIFPFGKTVNSLSLDSSSKEEFNLMSVMDAFPNVRSLTIGHLAWSEAEIQFQHDKGRSNNGNIAIKGLKQITAHLVLAEVELTQALIFDILGRCSDLSDVTLLVHRNVDSIIASNLMAKCMACNARVRWRLGNWGQ